MSQLAEVRGGRAPMTPAIRIGFYVVYGILAAAIGIRLVLRWREATDRRFDVGDRRLVGASVFYLLVPVTIALHEAGHAVAVVALGGRVTAVEYMLLWGEVAYEGPFGVWSEWLIALAGNVVSVALALVIIAWTVRRPGRAAWNYARLELARISLLLVLVLYPLFCLVGFPGDWTRLYAPATWPAGLPLLVLHVGAIVWALREWRGTLAPRRASPQGGRWKQRYRMLASPVRDALDAARGRLDQNPGDPAALLSLGSAYLAAGASAEALDPLRRAAEASPDDARSSFLLGLAELDRGLFPQAIETLCSAGRAAESTPMLSHEIVLALATARLRAGLAADALETADVAREERADDPRALLVWCDAAVAVGRAADATAELERALPRASGALAIAIRERLELIRKRA